MTKNEAIRLLAREALLMFEHDGSSTLYGNKTLHIIDKIFDEHEELIKPKSCDDCMFDYCGCSVQDSILRADNTATFETFCCNSFKKKDNA